MCKAEEELGNAFALVCELGLLMLTPVRHISFITLYSHVMQMVGDDRLLNLDPISEQNRRRHLISISTLSHGL